ncbi:MAG: ABC transporter permease [Roseivirga sp.]
MRAQPSKYWTRLFKRFCDDDFFEELQGDLEEKFCENVERHGASKAKSLYRAEVIKMIRPSVLRTPKFILNLSQLSLFQIHLKLAFRNIYRHKVFSIINIAGLAAAITLCLFAVNMIYTGYSYDRQHERSEDIYRVTTRVESEQNRLDFATSSYALTRHLRNIPQIEEVTFFLTNIGGSFDVKGETIPVDGYSIDESFFNIFSFEVVEGNPLALFNDLSSIVITDRVAKKLFGDQSAIGKTSKSGAIIRAVIKSPEKSSHFQFDFLHNIAFLGGRMSPEERQERLNTWINYDHDYYNYFRLAENADITSVNTLLDRVNGLMNAEMADGKRYTMEPQALTDIMFGDSYLIDMRRVHSQSTLITLLTIILLLTALASFNYTNLSVARSLQRSKEIGIRKITGSSRWQIMGQFITETTIFSFLALALALLAYQLLVPAFKVYIKEFDSLFSPDLSPEMLLWFALFCLLAGVMAGIFPALHFSKISPLQAISHKLKQKLMSLPNIKKALVGIQICVSTFCILFILTITDQKRQILAADLGYETEGLISLPTKNINLDLLKAALQKIPEVDAFTATSMIPGTADMTRRFMISQDHQDTLSVRYGLADARFEKVYAPEVTIGPGFTSGTSNEILVDVLFLESIQLPLDSAIGAQFYVTHYDTRELLKIVGVLQDYSYSGLSGHSFPIVIRNQQDSLLTNVLSLKISSQNIANTLKKIENSWGTISSNQEFTPVFVDDAIEKKYASFFGMMHILELGGAAIILIAILGQFGIALFNAESRVKEIGIRKVLGASYASLARLFSHSTLQMLIITTAIATPLVYYFFQEAIIPSFSMELSVSGLTIATGLLLIWGAILGIVMLQTLQTARINPSETLRNE